MSCVEKRHLSHRAGSMLHHRFPNGFTDLFMDETDREVSTLTDRAFRSLCIGDDAVYNDEFSYGSYSPFSCRKPIVGEPLKKSHHKESKKPGQKNISNMSSFLKALSATEESCEGMFIQNGDSNGESWDKSALRSIQKELSEFSSDYHANLGDGHYQNHPRQRSGSSHKTGKDSTLSSGKSSRIKNGKNTVKLRKLNIKNFFLHSEFSPFQTWRDLKQFPFGQEETATSILPIDNIPKWYDLSFYKELTDAHRRETQHAAEVQSCQPAAIEPPPPTAPKPMAPPPPPKVLPKPSAFTPAEQRCSSDVGEGISAPWRRNRSRANSAIPVNQPGAPSQDNNSKTVAESLRSVKKEARSVEVKAVEEVSSLASTPFSICQLMTPLIPSRQPTETSEILQAVLSPSVLELPLRPHSEAKVTLEPAVKRDSYKSLASSILFNLKDNRKRVKSRYSPPKFKTIELPEDGVQTPQSDHVNHSQAGSEGNASGFSTPSTFKDGQTVFSPVLEPAATPTVELTRHDDDRPLSDDYLLSNLLQTKKEASGGHGPVTKKQNYPSLNLYKKASPDDGDMKYHLSSGAAAHTERPTETHELSPLVLNKELSPTALPTNTGLSPDTLNVNKDPSPVSSPRATENQRLSSNTLARKRIPNVPDRAKPRVRDTQREKESGQQPVWKEKDSGGQSTRTVDVIRAAKEAINAAKSKALSAAQRERIHRPISDEKKEREFEERVAYSKEMLSIQGEIAGPENNVSSQSRKESRSASLVGKKSQVKKEPPPVPKRNFAKSDIEFALDRPPNCDLGDPPAGVNESVAKQAKAKRIFSARQNNYIKNQRSAVTGDVQAEENDERRTNTRSERGDKMGSTSETKDSEHIMNDLHALKELERARLGDGIPENAKNKSGITNIDDEARAKNDLISRELRNIKKGMLSMRGNTSAKRDVFAKKEKEQRKEALAKIDNNVRVNKALLNDNYDKAKMALEEIISERQRRRNTSTEDANPVFDESDSEESYVTRVRQCKQAMKDALMESREKQNGGTSTVQEKELKERLSNLKDHNHMRQILSQTEPRLGETHRLGGRIALPGLDRVDSILRTKYKHVREEIPDHPSYELEEVNYRNVARQISEDSRDNRMNELGSQNLDAPPVPPRSKKGGNRREESITNEINCLNDTVEEDEFSKAGKHELDDEIGFNEMIRTGSAKQEEEAASIQSETISPVDTRDVVNNVNLKSAAAADAVESILPSNYPQSPKSRVDEREAQHSQADLSPSRETTFVNSNAKSQQAREIKPNAPSKPDGNKVSTRGEEAEKINNTEEVNVDTETLGETPRNITSPLLMVNGISINQSPPDQTSVSSKSSYFSVDSATLRNTEPESNIYHSLEKLMGEEEEEEERMRNISDRTEGEYYSFSDHESEPELKRLMTSPQKETEGPRGDSKDGKTRPTTTDQRLPLDENNQTPLSPLNTFSPPLGIPSLFKVKDNTLNVKPKKTVQPWALNRSHAKENPENPELPLIYEAVTSGSTLNEAENLKPKEILTSPSPPPLTSPSNLKNETSKKPQVRQFLTVPQEEDRFSGVSPSSEGVESLATTGTADTADEMAMSTGAPACKVPSECSGSNYSGTESQTGLPKPPAVLPKSEKAVLKAVKLANRRMKKEEAQKSSQKSSSQSSSSKHRAERHKGDKSEQKTINSGTSKSKERKHREKTVEDGHHHHGDRSEQLLRERRGHNGENLHHSRAEVKRDEERQNRDLMEGNSQNTEVPPGATAERQGRSSRRNNKSERRHYSTDRVISNVPVYKANVCETPTSERTLHRSQSIDRYLGDKVQRRLSADTSTNEKLDPRTQRIEKSLTDGLQQRGRARETTSRDVPPPPRRRSHSIDAYGAEASHPSSLSRQSSHNSQLSRQSSMEHAIVTQAFPMTQRKLLQDPDSGQYFFVDMPVQVKTKTFFDPETGSYVQLPVQPPDGAIHQPSPMEVLTPPLVVYHSFVPVPLSPMAQKANLQRARVEPEEFEQRHFERSRQMHCKEGRPYLEPVFGQHDHILGEFMGTEELDCPS